MNNYYQVFWDPVTGCDRTSAGCKNCYAHVAADELRKFGLVKYRNGFETTIHRGSLEELCYFTKKPALVQLCQNSDLFNPSVPDDFIKEVINKTWEYPNHIFVNATKFIERLLNLNLEFPPNYLLGVTIEHSDYLWRAELLREVKVKQKGLLIAPILSAMHNLHLYLWKGMTQVQRYEERSPNPRPVDPAWVEEIALQCQEAGIPFLNLFRQPFTATPFGLHLSSLVFQLIEHVPGSIVLPTQFHPKIYEYIALCANLWALPYSQIKEKVRQVAPEFFEP